MNNRNSQRITDKRKRLSAFSKRKQGLLRKANELASLTGCSLLVAIKSETNNIYSYATDEFKPLIEEKSGRDLLRSYIRPSEGGKKPVFLNTTVKERQEGKAGAVTHLRLDGTVPSEGKTDSMLPHMDHREALRRQQTMMNVPLEEPCSEFRLEIPTNGYLSDSAGSDTGFGSMTNSGALLSAASSVGMFTLENEFAAPDYLRGNESDHSYGGVSPSASPMARTHSTSMFDAF
ncbi:hypothetical protein J8273_6756 [Carpediemonas membranifera]|uniref:MADS-box domain-containing protein n=1 Tax=Carpediemonas membranifera TaxID=201153 RepID=A0A8J6B100_9EUKA|nr:hypothetical protein J8273_6756 [Carpediemonas membranifera]|eukprot:KAG9391954.1 hypothetical protein J8273_6756 [Carpediemonas membranifera]